MRGRFSSVYEESQDVGRQLNTLTLLNSVYFSILYIYQTADLNFSAEQNNMMRYHNTAHTGS